jgi:hypothetical protein
MTTLFAAVAPASAANVTVKWYAQAAVKFTLTPNYASGCGTVKASFGTQPTPAAPPQGCMNGGAVDFGGVLSGTDYLYKYASHLNVVCNDANGVNVYGEGAADFYNTTDGSSTPLNQTLYYLNSTSGGTDTNTGFSSSLPFFRTTSSVSGNTFSTTPSIAYTAYPAPIASTMTNATSDFYYDYQLKVPPVATSGSYYVWIVYTVVPK